MTDSNARHLHLDQANRTVFRETVISLLSGGSLSAIIANTRGYEELMAFLDTLSPSSEIFDYFLLLLAFSVGFWGLERTIVYFRDRVPNWLNETRIISHQLGNSLHSVYRMLAGASIISAIPIIFVQPNPSNLAIASIALVFGAGALSACLVLSKFSKYLEP